MTVLGPRIVIPQGIEPRRVTLQTLPQPTAEPEDVAPTAPVARPKRPGEGALCPRTNTASGKNEADE